jgi:hypothetical protein
MFCTQCGNSLQATAKFCTKCGKQVATLPAQPVTEVAAAAPAAATAPDATPNANQDASQYASQDSTQADPFKPAGMNHADYAYQGLPPVSASSKSGGSKRGLLIGLTAVVAVLLAIVGMSLAGAGKNNTASQDSSTSQQDTSSDPAKGSLDGTTDSNSGFSSASWVPAGFTLWDQDIFDFDMAYRFVTETYDEANVDCDGCSFWAVEAVSEASCPGGAYAEVDVLDDAGNKIDFTNDVVDYVGYGDTVTFILKTYEANAATARITDLNCYDE